MRFGPWELRRHQADVAEAAEQRAPRTAGASGTVNYDGFLDGAEYNADLKGLQGLKVFRRMLSSDAAVQEALHHLTAPIKNATWDVEPASDDLLDVEIAEAVRRAYFDWPTDPFLQHLDEALEFLPLGHYLFETEWQIVDAELEVDDPSGQLEPDPADPTGQRKRRKKLQLPPRQFLTWRRFGPRLPETIFKWNEQDGELVSVTQNTWKDGTFEQVEIEAEQLLVFTNQRRGNDYTGRSILRAAHKPWLLKEMIEKVSAMAVERHGVGVPIAYPPDDARNDDAVISRLETILQNLRSGPFSYIVAPGPKALASASAGNGWTFEILSPSGGVPDFTPLLEYHRGEIKGALLARFSELGHGSVGARATSDTQSEVWTDALHAVARYFADVHSGGIRRWVQANYDHDRYPTLVARDIESKNLAEFAEANARLVVSGAIKADRSYREFIRRTIDAPDEDDPEADDEPADPQETEPEQDRIEDEPDDATAVLARKVNDLRESLRALATTPTPAGQAPIVNFPERLVVALEEPIVIPPAEVTVQAAEQPAPVVNVPAAKPPVVNVKPGPAPQVTVNVPAQKPPQVNVEQPKAKRKRVHMNRDKDGRIKDATVVEEG